ncbi:complement receptor type 1-like isoform X2 [Mauremys reevesii]|uniref:complement receptor type 1-like isoform X2 n=1 Tax=Mauremys reevesii TaxID=260615 RepID=UPI00193FC541|nr:complement receptor type 1-like isoform X2 [Mauremys reevesii]
MVSAPRCRPGARGLLALLLLLPLAGARGQCGALPRLSRASPYDTSCTEGCPVGTEVTYRCLDGFVKIPGKSDTVVCLQNSEWSPFGEFCSGGCGAPPRLKSAKISEEDGQKNYCPPGTTVSYDCRPGYESSEVKPVVTCLENLTWSEAPEFCRGKSCGVPKGPEHGRAVLITNDLCGARANIICDDGFRLHGRSFILCLPKGDQVEWSQLPTCQDRCWPPGRRRRDTDSCGGGSVKSLGTCDSPPSLSFAELPGAVNNSYPVGTKLKCSCRPGYVLRSGKSPLVTCLANSTWSVDPEFCVAIPCRPPPDITHGSHTGQHEQEFSFGSAVTYKCDQGFSLIGEASIHCTTKDNVNGEWSGPAPECKGIPCKQLELENGRVHLKDRQVGATANFSCDEGYRLIGTTSAQCVVAENGVNWDKELPHCQAIPCLPPPDIANGSHTGQSEQEFSFGSAVTYKCDKGFSLIGKASTHCTTKDNVNGEWSGPAPECKAIPCPPPPDIANGSHTGQSEQEFSFGSAVTYKCDKGFSLIGEASIHCTMKDNVNGEWSGPAPECKAIPCPPPPDITHGSHTGQSEQEFSFGSVVTYKCDQGFSLIGEASIHCTTKDNVNGEWSGPAPECKAIPCLPPPDITSGSHTGQSEQEFSFGSAVTYKCDQGFSLIGEASIHCTTKDNINGEWSGPAPECKGICDSPPRLSFAELPATVNDSYPVGTKLKYSCRPGYVLGSGKSPLVVCLANSTWSVDPEFCVGRLCKQLELENGRVDLTDLRFGATATFSCDEGYRLIGTISAQCVVVGNGVNWDKRLPHCQAIPCLPPPDIANGSHTGQSEQEFSFGSAVTYKCDQGFSLIGEASIHCTTKDNVNGEWSGPAPECKGQCGAPPRLIRAVPHDTSCTEGCPIGTQVTYRCRDGFVKIPGKSDTVVCLSNLEWSAIGEFCSDGCGALPRLKSATLSKEDGQKNYSPPGSTVTYECRPGYESTEVKPVITCLENLTWSEAPEFCRGKSCGVPKGPEHGRAVVLTNDLYGARANVICDKGFRLHGRTFIQCLLKGDQVEWSQLPTCQGKSCGVPKGPEHGRAVVLTNDLYGARANVICDEGFRLHGRTFIQCLLKGDQVEWSQLPTCQAITCSPPPNITNGMHNGSNVEIFVYNSSVTYKCDHNFSLIGEASIHCTTKDNINGVWNGSAPECKGPCDSPPRLSFAELPGVVNNSYPVGTELKYSCRPGYVLGSEKSPLVTCLANSTWSVDPEICVGIPCKQLELENGRVHLTDHRVGATATFSCNEGYRLIGTTSAQCVVAENGVNWDKDLPHCQAIPCHPPPDIANGSHTGQSEQEFSFGSAVTYKCDKGYSLIGEASIHCTTKDNVNGEWSGPVPKCKAIPCRPPPDITHGSHTGQSEQELSFGSAVTYKCDQGFCLIREASIHCTTKDNVNGEWSGPVPECKVIITQNKPTTVPPEGAEVTGTSSVIITQDKPTTVPPERAEVAGTSSDSALNTAGNSAEPEVEVIITQDKPTTVPPERAEVAGTSSGPGIDTYIIGIIIAVILIVILVGIGNIVFTV